MSPAYSVRVEYSQLTGGFYPFLSGMRETVRRTKSRGWRKASTDERRNSELAAKRHTRIQYKVSIMEVGKLLEIRNVFKLSSYSAQSRLSSPVSFR